MALPQPLAAGVAMLPAGTFDGAVVMVTGGGTGIGKAIAVEFARLEAAVAVVSRNPHHGVAGVKAVEEAGGKGFATGADVREPDAVRDAFDAVEEALGPVSILINNAAVWLETENAAQRLPNQTSALSLDL